jgi:para-aminobenzoate synthetase component 1
LILLESGPDGCPATFADPVEVVEVWDPAGVAPALARLEHLRASGCWIAGQIGYEAGYALEPRLMPHMPGARDEPLLVFGAYPGPADAAPVLAQAAESARGVALAPLVPQVDRGAYDAAFARLMDYIGAGDVYQVNLTFPMESRLLSGTPLQLYGALRARQAVGFGAYLDLGTGPVVVSRSPELFFSLDAEGGIAARPMKGTAPRGADPAEDAALAADLYDSPKVRAENLMIVDLLRNDISRIARVGSVRVPELFKVEPFATVHQMSSLVVGRLAGPVDFAAIMAALFPCGSITGAPKIRAMEIIRELEPYPRGTYCGAIGWMAPDGRAAFNVAIRTLRIWPDGRVRLNVGGGIVQDSTATGEWEEALWKTRYAQGLVTSG